MVAECLGGRSVKAGTCRGCRLLFGQRRRRWLRGQMLMCSLEWLEAGKKKLAVGEIDHRPELEKRDSRREIFGL